MGKRRQAGEAAAQKSAHGYGIHAEALPRNLHDALARGQGTIEEDGNSDDGLAANEGDGRTVVWRKRFGCRARFVLFKEPGRQTRGGERDGGALEKMAAADVEGLR